MTDLSRSASALDGAVTSATAIPQLSRAAELTLRDAYRIQALCSDLRVARGDVLVGAKLGFTSKAKAAQMGVSDVIVGRLHASMAYAAGGAVPLAALIHPRIEPEVAFRLGTAVDLRRSADPVGELRAAVDAVAPALEIIDSRYLDFRFSLADVIADNTSAGGFVVGGWTPADLGSNPPAIGGRPVTLEIDGAVAASGNTDDILGDPCLAVPVIARLGAAQRIALPAGAVLLAGGATAAVPLTPGATVTVTITGFGTASVTATGAPRGGR